MLIKKCDQFYSQRLCCVGGPLANIMICQSMGIIVIAWFLLLGFWGRPVGGDATKSWGEASDCVYGIHMLHRLMCALCFPVSSNHWQFWWHTLWIRVNLSTNPFGFDYSKIEFQKFRTNFWDVWFMVHTSTAECTLIALTQGRHAGIRKHNNNTSLKM